MSISENLPDATSVVEIAKDTIQVLAHLNRTTNIYHTQQACFNYFLVAALAALFLAVCHGPTYFSETCRLEFYMALDLVKGFSAKSLISRRLWKTIKDLQSLGPKLGVTPDMAGEDRLSGVAIDQFNPHTRTVDAQHSNQDWNGADVWPDQHYYERMSSDRAEIGSQMTYALTDLYGIAEGNANRSSIRSSHILENGASMQHQDFATFENNDAVSGLLETLF